MRRVLHGPEGGNRFPLGEQESVGGDAQCGVMVEATPSSPLVVTKPEFLLEVPIVALDPPTQLGGLHQRAATDGGGQRGQKVLGRLLLVGRPFDQAPLLWSPASGSPTSPRTEVATPRSSQCLGATSSTASPINTG